MTPNKTRTWLLIGLVIFSVASGAMGRDIRDMQLFAPAEVSPYGDGPEPAEGFFFTFDGMFWWIGAPKDQPIGFPNLTRNVYFGPEDSDMVVQTNTHNTGMLGTDMVEGNRFEVGRVIDRFGWFLSVYDLKTQTSRLTTSEMDVVFVDDEFGSGLELLEGYFISDPTATPPTAVRRNLPVTFDHVYIENKVEHWSVELNAMYRTRRRHHGGFLEFFAGARYMEFHEEFNVDARGHVVGATTEDDDDTTIERWFFNRETGEWEFGEIDTGGDGLQIRALGDSYWNTRVENNIIGPQLGIRWFRQHGRWRLSAQGRFFAGFNNQNVSQRGVFGTDLDPSTLIEGRPANFDTTGYSNDQHALEFSPGAETRFDLHYQFSRAISFKVGWTGLWIDGIARPSSMINYEVPTMGINMANNRDTVFVHGLNIGVEVNR